MSRGIHLISNGKWETEDFISLLIDIHPYIHYVHIREKQKTPRALFQMIARLIEHGVPKSKIIINDRADLAALFSVKGVHLGEQSPPVQAVKKRFPDFTLGRSVHDLSGAQSASQYGADFLIFGHVYPTSSKPGQKAKGIYILKEIVEHVSVPVIPIGGIQPKHIPAIYQTGADGFAVMSGILDARNPRKAARDYFETYQNHFVQGGISDESCH
ncbi:MAG: thiamine phosphate synthase [Bacillaceae bacterium]|nr:thiamine phosphate synthase [Bacillaceae bacterium]